MLPGQRFRSGWGRFEKDVGFFVVSPPQVSFEKMSLYAWIHTCLLAHAHASPAASRAYVHSKTVLSASLEFESICMAKLELKDMPWINTRATVNADHTSSASSGSISTNLKGTKRPTFQETAHLEAIDLPLFWLSQSLDAGFAWVNPESG